MTSQLGSGTNDRAGTEDGGSMPSVYLNGATVMTTPTDRSLEVAREAGFVGVEVRTERLLGAPDELSATAARVRQGEVWSVNGLQVHLTPDGALDRADLARALGPRLAIATAVGASYLLVVPPRIAGVDREVALDSIRDGVSEVAERAAASGIRVAFEFLGFANCPVDSPALAARVVAGLPDVALVLDSCHWHASGSASLDGFPVERLAMVHLNDAPAKEPREIEDADRVLPGDGVIRLRSLVDELGRRRYHGPFSLETFNPRYWNDDPTAVATDGWNRLSGLLG